MLSDGSLERLRRAAQTIDGQYELRAFAGAGGMGAVFEATDPRTDERVAVKILTVCTAEQRRRFSIEATILERLQHPAIVRYLAHGTTLDGRPYIAMEWLDGESLAQRLARGPLDAAATMVLGQRIATALEIVHREGIIHRDLKPSNIFLVGGDPARAKLIDFGVARWPAASANTNTGALVGTIGYLAPEQARNRRDLDGRVDLFALGCVLYECLTGRRAFEGDGITALVALIDLEPKRPSHLAQTVPVALDDLVCQLLAADRDDRPADAEAVRARLAGEPPHTIAPEVSLPTHRLLPRPRIPDSARRLSAGVVIDERYTIVRFIAAGGMAEVYEADDRIVGSRVAMKFMLDEVAELTEQFRKEIQLARLVTHRNVCRIFDIGVHGTTPFLTMELLEGESLHARIKRAPLSLADALPLIRQMTDALAAAHGAGIVHRDFKSANVMLVPDRRGTRVVVCDFGLAQAIGEGNSEVAGTPAYMAPEQLRGEIVGPAADIYALGVVMYEMATSELPFAGDSTFALAAKRADECAPSARDFVHDLDGTWTSVIARCLDPDPARRFASPADAGAAFGVARGRRWRRAALAAIVVLAVAGSALVVWNRTARQRVDDAYEDAAAHWRRKDFAEARASAERALAADPHHAMSHLLLAKMEYEKGDHARSAEHAAAAKAAIGDVEDGDELRIRAYLALAAGNAKATCDLLSEVYDQAPLDIDTGLDAAYACHTDRANERVRALLARLRETESADPRIDLLEARIAQHHARYKDARRSAETARARADSAVWIEVEAQLRIAWQAFYLVDPEAPLLAARALELARSIGNTVDENDARKLLMSIADRDGRLRDAARLDAVRLDVYKQLHRDVSYADALNSIGARQLELLEPLVEVEKHFKAELAVYRRHDNINGIALATSDLGNVAFEQGDFQTAEEHWENARKLFEELGNPVREGRQQIALARLARIRGELDRAGRLLDAAAHLVGGDAAIGVRLALERGELLLSRGDPHGAVALLTTTHRAATTAGLVLEAVRANTFLARAQLAAGERDQALATVMAARAGAANAESVHLMLEAEISAALLGIADAKSVVDRYRVAGYVTRANRAELATNR